MFLRLITLFATVFTLSASALGAAPDAQGFRIKKSKIPMKDGVRLSVSLFVPEKMADTDKFPVILEYLPYRKDDYMAAYMYETHSYYAKRGIISAVVDIRGTGSSEGTLPNREYSEQEQLDGMEVIDWLSRMPNSNGNVGMFGISWSGFNAIQLAMRKPPALKAIIAVDASDKLFHDDIHYVDGMMHIDEFALSMDLQSSISAGPNFSTVESDLKKRFDQTPWFISYLNHQREDAFWDKGSLATDYSAIQIPVFMIGGLLDGYRDSIPRMLENMKVPMKALIGPWNHAYPHDSGIGPVIEWRTDAVRWWKHWLKGEDTGLMQEPPVTVFMRDAHKPSLELETIPGKWFNLPQWSRKAQPKATFYLGANHGLSKSYSESATHELEYVPSSGIEAGLWWGDLTGDQRPVDAMNLTYDTAPMKTSMSIMGLPKVKLWVSASAPQANWMVRISDIAPDGKSTLITGAGLNGAHRDSPREPKALEPGKLYPIEFDLHFTSWVLPEGHRLRVSVGNALWPMIFPTPHSMTTTLSLGVETPSQIQIPLLPVTAKETHFEEPTEFEEIPGITAGEGAWPGKSVINRDPVNRTTTLKWSGESTTIYPWGTETDSERLQYQVSDLEPAKSSVQGFGEAKYVLKDRIVSWSTQIKFSSDVENFYYTNTRRLKENGKVIRKKTWTVKVPRDHQ